MGGKHSRNRKNRPLVIVLSLAMIFSAMTAFWSFGDGTADKADNKYSSSTPTVTSAETGTENQTGSTTSNGTEGDGSPSTETNKSPVSSNSLVPGTDSGTQVQSSTGAADNKASDIGEESTSNGGGIFKCRRKLYRNLRSEYRHAFYSRCGNDFVLYE